MEDTKQQIEQVITDVTTFIPDLFVPTITIIRDEPRSVVQRRVGEEAEKREAARRELIVKALRGLAEGLVGEHGDVAELLFHFAGLLESHRTKRDTLTGAWESLKSKLEVLAVRLNTRPFLKERDKEVLHHIPKYPDGITGPQLSLKTDIPVGSLSKHVIPNLVKYHGVMNKRGIGYYVE